MWASSMAASISSTVKSHAWEFLPKKRFLAPIYSTSVVQQVIDRLSNAIIDGELKPGDKLPTEPELASLFKVGRNSIREAVRILVAYGVLEIRRPEGTYVCTDFSAKTINPMLYHIILQKENAYQDLVDLRKMIENGVMHMVLEKDITEAELNGIQLCCDKLVNRLKNTPSDTQAILEADIAFHDEIAKATRNSLIPLIHSVVVELTRDSRAQTIQEVIRKGDVQYLIDTHIRLMDVIRSRDFKNLDQVLNDSYFFWKDIYQ